MPEVEVQTLGPEHFAPNTAKKIETAVKSRPGKAETTVSLALGPLGWLHLLNRWITIPMAYDLVDDAHIVVTDIAYEQGWSVRGARRMTGEGVDGKTQFEARLNLYTFGMSFILAPEVTAARGISEGSGGGGFLDDMIKGFDDVINGASDDVINGASDDVIKQTVPDNTLSVQTGAQLLENTAAQEVSAEGAVWAQRTFNGTFSTAEGAKFAGQTVEGLADALRSGTLSAADVPINVVVRNGQTFILNTRSSAALMQAGVPRSSWNVINQTGVPSFESMLTGQLERNGLINGVNSIRQSGTQLILTH